MKNSYKEIDTNKWVRKTTFEWFEKFSNPTYCFNAKIDVSDVVNYFKQTGTSFFINFLYLISRVNNEIESLRLRYVDNRVLLYETINPTFTVKTTDGSFNNAGVTTVPSSNLFKSPFWTLMRENSLIKRMSFISAEFTNALIDGQKHTTN